MPADECQATVEELDEGREYEFRVIPVNEAGPGAESPPTALLKTKARRGKQRQFRLEWG